MIAVTVVPVCAMALLLCVPIWPWQAALGHVAALGLLGLILVDAADAGTRKIPFACSYLPGRSRFHLVFVVIVVVVIPLVLAAASFELDALQNPARYGAMFGLLVVVWLLARWRIWRLVHPDDGAPAFDDEPGDRVVTLELWDSRVAGPISNPVSRNRSS